MEPESSLHPEPTVVPSWLRGWLVALVVVGFSVLYFLNAWVSEDAHIYFRVAEQFFAGNGLVWNPDERVQVYTSPLWMLCQLILRGVTTDLYLASIAAGYVLSLAAICNLRRVASNTLVWATAVGCLVSCAGWMDFTAGGLENALLYFLLTVVLVGMIVGERAKTTRDYAAVSAGLLLVTRHDTLMLLWPFLLLLLLDGEVTSRRRLRRALYIAVPLLLWSTFSVLYYGSPIPNTAFAKLPHGIGRYELIRQSQHYWRYAVVHDPLSMIAILLAALAVVAQRSRLSLATSAAIVSTCVYITWIGADYMGGRFYGPIVLLSVTRVAALCRWTWRAPLAVLVLLLVYQWSFPYSTFRDAERNPMDDAIAYAGVVKGKEPRDGPLSFTRYLALRGEPPFPDTMDAAKGLTFRSQAERFAIEPAIGVFGYYAGTNKIILDPLALADPFLARLPVSGVWRAGHFYRCLPTGYEETRRSGINKLQDPILRDYYDHVRPIYVGPLFTGDRLRRIVALNLGLYDAPLRAYVPDRGRCEPRQWMPDHIVAEYMRSLQPH